MKFKHTILRERLVSKVSRILVGKPVDTANPDHFTEAEYREFKDGVLLCSVQAQDRGLTQCMSTNLPAS